VYHVRLDLEHEPSQSATLGQVECEIVEPLRRLHEMDHKTVPGRVPFSLVPSHEARHVEIESWVKLPESLNQVDE